MTCNYTDIAVAIYAYTVHKKNANRFDFFVNAVLFSICIQIRVSIACVFSISILALSKFFAI